MDRLLPQSIAFAYPDSHGYAYVEYGSLSGHGKLNRGFSPHSTNFWPAFPPFISAPSLIYSVKHSVFSVKDGHCLCLSTVC